ncbi:MAG: hypothetical protein IPM14_05230 [bacterium]|nr:hypothetical protein [bacterium]
MARLINFDNYKPTNSNLKGMVISPSTSHLVQNVKSEVDNPYQLTLDVLIQNHPQKVVFSISEAAKLLGVGSEFIRRRVKSGKINAIYLGDKPFINIVELARISIEGV